MLVTVMVFNATFNNISTQNFSGDRHWLPYDHNHDDPFKNKSYLESVHNIYIIQSPSIILTKICQQNMDSNGLLESHFSSSNDYQCL